MVHQSKSWIVLSFLFILAATSSLNGLCISNEAMAQTQMANPTMVSNNVAPEWVSRRGAVTVHGENEFLGLGTAVGLLDATERKNTAESNAREDLADILQKYTKIYLKKYQEEKLETPLSTTQAQTVVNQVTQQALEASRVKKYWEDPARDEAYAQARLTLQQFVQIWDAYFADKDFTEDPASEGKANGGSGVANAGDEVQTSDFSAPQELASVPGEVIIKYRSGVTQMSMNGVVEGFALTTMQTFDFAGMQQASIPAGQTVEEMISQLATRPEVEYVEPNYYVYAEKAPNDPKYAQQWGIKKINGEKAWNTVSQSPGVIVAVIDTGVDYLHPDLQGNMWKNPDERANGIDDDGNGIVDDIFGANFSGRSPSGDPMDDNRHGTHVAGIISATGNNGVGITGTTWKTQIMALKFLTGSGRGSTAGAIQAIEYAVKKGAHIMNNSWGGGGASRALEDAIKRADQQGILFVAAAGNSNSDNDARPHFPSNYKVPNVLSVMATDPSDRRAGFSNWGKNTVHVAAPGVRIFSTLPLNMGSYGALSGTSMATPFVAGAAALLKAQNPLWDARQLKERLMQTVEKPDNLKNTSISGGRINLAKLIGTKPAPPSPTPPPTSPKPGTKVCMDGMSEGKPVTICFTVTPKSQQ